MLFAPRRTLELASPTSTAGAARGDSSPQHERLRAARPADTNLQVALGATAGLGTLFVEPAANRGASTMVPELAER